VYSLSAGQGLTVNTKTRRVDSVEAPHRWSKYEMSKFSVLFALNAALAVILSGSVTASAAQAQSAAVNNDDGSGKTATTAANAHARSVPRSRYRPTQLSGSASRYYSLIWGVDGLSVKAVESGELIRFSYRIVDANKAETLNDKKLEPSLLAPRAGVRLEIPQLEKVGKLRQSSTPESGKTYWMAFSNKGRLVKPGDHVSIVIGKFRADGLIVE